jgi:hypothetical protein
MDGLFAEDITASPSLINQQGTFGVTWNGMPGERGDWIGLYSVNAPDSNPWLWVQAEAPSYTWTLPAVFPVGEYEFRMFDDFSFDKIGESNALRIQDPYAPFLIDDLPIDTRPNPAPNPAPIDNSRVVYDLSNVMWDEGAPGRDASYYDGVSFAGGEVNYVTTPVPGPLPYGGKLVATLKLTDGPLVSSDGVQPLNLVNLNFFIQRLGDDWTGRGAFNDYRQWGGGIVLNDKADGTFVAEVPLLPQHWNGVFDAGSDAGFAATLANAWRIGWTHGDALSAGHGNADAGGAPAKIEVVEFKILAP